MRFVTLLPVAALSALALAAPAAEPATGLVTRQDTPVSGIPAHHMMEHHEENRKDEDHQLKEKEWEACKRLFMLERERQSSSHGGMQYVKRQDDPSHTKDMDGKKGKKKGEEGEERHEEHGKKGKKKEKGEEKEKEKGEEKEKEKGGEREHGKEREHGEERKGNEEHREGKAQWDKCMRMVHEREQRGEEHNMW